MEVLRVGGWVGGGRGRGSVEHTAGGLGGVPHTRAKRPAQHAWHGALGGWPLHAARTHTGGEGAGGGGEATTTGEGGGGAGGEGGEMVEGSHSV